MPIYEYRCIKCGEVFSALKLAKKDDGAKCPDCGSSDVKKQISSFSSFGGSSFGSGSFGGGGG